MVTQGISWWRTALGEAEIRAITGAIAAEHISQGELTERFESELASIVQVPHAVATTSGSVALLLAYLAIGVGPGDEVIIPDRTFIATAHAPLLLGARVVLVDTHSTIPTIDVSRIERMINPKTRAIAAVHLNGRSVDMRALHTVASHHGVHVIEDAAQAFLSRNADGPLGTQSAVGCFSFGMTKLVSTGQGGAVVTRDPAIHERLKLMRNHGVVDTLRDDYMMFGFNFKFTDLLASIGLVQLGGVQEKIEHVNAVYERYRRGLSECPLVRLIPVDTSVGEIPLWVEVLSPKRPELMAFLAARDIQTRQFLPSLHRSPHLGNAGEFPNADVFDDQGLFLPGGPAQPLCNVDRVLEAIRDFHRS